MAIDINTLSVNGVGTKLAADQIILTGIEFAQFAESQPDIWSRVQGAIISHADFGGGIIETVQQRKGHIPQLIIKFSSKSTISKFNSDAFKTGKFTNVQIPDELLDLLTAWKKQMAIGKAQVAAEKATQKKTREKKGAGQKPKGIECDHGPFNGPAMLARHIKIAHGRVISVDDCKQMFKEKRILIPPGTESLSEFKLTLRRRHTAIKTRGLCHYCNKYSSSLLKFEQTPRGEVILCKKHISRKSDDIDLLDSWVILPGNFGG